MADKTYVVNRSMHGDGRDYERGDLRQMAEADAAELVVLGALTEEGKETVARSPAVRHTFGSEPSSLAERGYTTPTSEGVIAGTPAVAQSVDTVTRPAVAAAPRKRHG